MDTEDPDPDKPNVCPICKRAFPSLRGLKQHWTKGHSAEEINAAIANKDQSNATGGTRPAAVPAPTVNKLQIIPSTSDDHTIQFNIMENDSAGECLFFSLLDFLKDKENGFTNIPNDASELRQQTVRHVLEGMNFQRFKNSIVENLQSQIPDLVKDDNLDETIKNSYAQYMSLPGKYGTTVELCAAAELFEFTFYVVQRNNTKSYTVYDYGSTLTPEREGFGNKEKIVFLLFTGKSDDGHFRRLSPIEDAQHVRLLTGEYNVLEDYSTSKLTTISPATEKTVQNPPIGVFSILSNAEDQQPLDCNFEDFILLLARCRRDIKVLKRIPRGARVSAANSLAKAIDECLVEPTTNTKWMRLLTFAYTSLQVPDKIQKFSLTTLVKRNIAKPTLVFRKRAKNKTQTSISKRIEYKIAEGNVKGAVKILSSTDTLAPQNQETLNKLKLKHPPPTRPLNLPEPPDEHNEHLIVSGKDVVRNISSFPNGSASGIDGILPQHLKDLTTPFTGEAGLKLVQSITNLSNFMLAGKIPNELCAIMYGASLCALNKEEGGIRPIAVGNTFRRLTAKLASASVRSDMSSKFAPRQVGYGTRGGCEAAAHATRTFVKKNRNKPSVVLKIDFRNAFNELDRDKFLQEMRINCPGIYPFLWQCYATSSLLFYGEDTIWSQNGAQQGDPCGPLLFCSAIQAVVAALISEFVVFYLDDGTIAGNPETVLQDFDTVIKLCGTIGLSINPSKCELYFCSEVDPEVVNQFDKLSPGIIVVNELTLLGAPITDNAFIQVFRKKLGQLKLLFGRLTDLDNYQIAYYLLRNCLSIPKLVFLLRTSPAWNNIDLIEEMDNCIKSTLETLTNSKLQHDQWILSSLPVRYGGLGIRRVQDLSLPAFLSSVNGMSSTVSTMLHQPSLTIEDISDYTDGINAWQNLNPGTSLPEVLQSQKHWDTIQIDRLFNELQFDQEEDVARILAIQKPESGAWLNALPSRNLGTLLENNVFRILVGIRLGVDICVPHTCVCGSIVTSKGLHGLKCKKSAGRGPRHSELNNTIKRTLTTVDIPARLEPPGLFREDGKRVDGISLIPWHKGKTLVWDATCTDTYAPSNLRHSTRTAGKAADEKAKRKESKYKSLIERNYHFIPFAVETMGPWCHEAVKFFDELGKMLTLKTNDPRSKSFLKQRISMAIQKGNAAAIMGTFERNDNMEEVFYL